jgi:hypothetical protein
MEADDWYVLICPNDERIRAHHLGHLRVLLERHGESLVGIWLDFIRYPMRWEVAQPRLVQTCFCDRCLGGFLGELGRAYTADERRDAARAGQNLVLRRLPAAGPLRRFLWMIARLKCSRWSGCGPRPTCVAMWRQLLA